MQKVLLIFLGGGLGSCLRYFFSKLNPFWSFLPLGTLLANILSCLVVGFVAYLLEKHFFKHDIRSLVLVGFCGGFSTFSTFANEILTFFKQENFLEMGFYLFLSIVLGNLFLVLGMVLAKYFLAFF